MFIAYLAVAGRAPALIPSGSVGVGAERNVSSRLRQALSGNLYEGHLIDERLDHRGDEFAASALCKSACAGPKMTVTAPG